MLVKRALRPWGTYVINIGDRYKDKRLLRIPDKVADSMEEIGFFLFQEAIWSKGNGMPRSEITHFRPDYEKILFFAQQDNYYFDLKAVKVPLADSTMERDKYPVGSINSISTGGINSRHSRTQVLMMNKERTMPDIGGFKHAGNNTSTVYSGKKVKNHDGLAYLGSVWKMEDVTWEAVWDISPQLGRFKQEYCETCNVLRSKDSMWKRCGKCHEYRFEKDEECKICKIRTNHEIMCSVCNKRVHSHWAMFPEALAERVIKSCCPEFVCAKCGAPVMPTYDDYKINTRPGHNTNTGRAGGNSDPNKGLHGSEWSKFRQLSYAVPTGYKSLCICKAEWHVGVVLDPFMGWGTTAVVAKKNSRNFIGCELDPLNIKASKQRLRLV